MIRVLLVLLAWTGIRAADPALLRNAFVFVGNGSGVVVSADGLVLTNHHVAKDLERIEVRTRTGRTVPAVLLGSDPVGDLALLRAQAQDWEFADFASPTELRPGIAVVAVGNPFGLGDLDDLPSVTFGVLATGRVARGGYVDAVVSDAPVNPGNSGGPLFAADTGHLLGINGAIRSRSGLRVNTGIGLAISAVQLARFLPVLETAGGGLIHRTTLPKSVTLTDGPEGPLVTTAVEPLRVGDRIMSVDERPVAGAEAARCFAQGQPWQGEGTTIAMVVARGSLTVPLRLSASRLRIPGRAVVGLQVKERDGMLAVTAVDEDGPAARAGLRTGQILASVGGTPVTSRIAWLRATAALEPGDRLVLGLAAGDQPASVITIAIPAEL